MRRRQGKVDIVGAGPGGLAYLTLAGKRLILQAEVLIYDALIHPEILTLAPEKCLCLPMGKRGGQPSVAQADINQILVQYCRQGKRVVRLKCGDPFIFGRTVAEIGALVNANCAVQVWPGLSAALVAPLLAGIPLTDARLSNGFTVVSGHAPQHMHWERLAQSEALVILMGTQALSTIVEQLLKYGQNPERPVAIIHQGGWAQQQVWVGTLTTIVEKTQGQALSPAVIVVGEVVSLRSSLEIACSTSAGPLQNAHFVQNSRVAMAKSKPLHDQTILVTRAASQASTFCDRLSAAGAKVLELPALEIVPPSTWEPLDVAIAKLQQFHWLILTSANGVNYFLDRLLEHRDLRSLSHLQIAVVGRKTATTLKQRGLKADFIPPNFVADSLVEHFPQSDNLKGLQILFPRVETGGRDVLVAQLNEQGAIVTEIPAYQSQCPSSISSEVLEALQSQTIDVVTFASSKTVKYFGQLLLQAASEQNQNWRQWLQRTKIASIGPQTSVACQQLLGRVDMEAAEYTLDGLVQSILEQR